MLGDAEFAFRNGVLTCEDVDLAEVAACHGTPAYVYSKQAVVNRFRAYDQALAGFPHRVCYAVKANSNHWPTAVLRIVLVFNDERLPREKL